MLKQRVKASFDKHVFLREPRNQLPLDDERVDDDLRVFSKWLLVVPIVLALVLGFGQAALLWKTEIRTAGTQSKLSAEYSPWEFFPVRSLREGLVDEIQIDNNGQDSARATFEKPIVVTGQDWINARAITTTNFWQESELVPSLPTSSPFTPTPE